MFSSKRERSGAELLPGSGEAFTERLNMLASTVSATAAALAKTNGELVVLRRDLGNGLARIEELVAEMRSRARAGDVRDLEKKVAALAFENPKTSDAKRLDDLGSNVAKLAERVDTLASTVATTASSVAGRDGEVAALRRQFGEGPHGQAVDEALLRRVEDIASASASASMRLESHGGQIDTVKRRVDEAGEQLSGMAQRLEGLDERLSDVAQRTDSADERLSEVTLRVEADENERMLLATSVADAAAARWRELDRALATLAERLDEVEERGSAVSAELARTTSLWPAALRSLETRVEELASDSPPSETDNPQPVGDDAHVLVALRTLEQRLQHADEAAREEREIVLERLERLSGQLHERLESTRMPVGANIVPFRTDP